MAQHSRRRFLKTGLHAAALPAAGALFGKKRPEPRFNVLLIVVDDLRPDLGCYGHPLVSTPNIDRIASEGLTFERAYCQQALSHPSRTSMMTSRRPDSTRVYDAERHFRRSLPEAVTLPQQFRRHGYQTTAFGKIFQRPQLDDRPSWSVPPWAPETHPWGSAENRRFFERKWRELREANWTSAGAYSYDPARRFGRGPDGGWDMPSWESRDVADAELADGQIATAALEALGELRAGGRFFLAVGFLKPHLPFVAPQRYFERYPLKRVPPRDKTALMDVPLLALHDSEELRLYRDIPPEGPIGAEKERELIRAYYACTSYVDAQIGRLLQGLEDARLRDDTVVVVWGDHGYHLGDHGLWSKRTNFEAAARCPLIIRAPGQRGKGRKTDALTEAVDIYPSLCEICNVPRPEGLEGASFVPLFEDPERLWKRAVFSQYPRNAGEIGSLMGYSMRTRRYRYTEWLGQERVFRASELYDHENDPGETTNIANRPGNLSLVNGLSGMLEEGWRSSLPPTETS